MIEMPIKYPTVVHMLKHSAEQHPQKEALVCGEVRLSYQEYAGAVAHMASELLQMHPSAQRVAIVMPNSAEFAVTIFACLAAGLQTAPLNPLYTEHELNEIIEDCHPDILIAGPDAFDKAASIAKKLGLAKPLMVGGAGFQPLNFIHTDFKSLALPSADGLSILQYTGGTTGRSKGVNITHAATSTNVSQRQAVVPIKAADRLLVMTPLYHVYASSMGVFAAVFASATLVIMPSFTPESAIDTIKKEKITFIAGSPTIYQSILASDALSTADFSHLKLCFSGASALPEETLRTWESKTGALICEAYGQTETGPVISANPRDGARKSGSVGIVLPETIVEIVDADQGEQVLGANEIGEIRVKGPQAMSGYRNRPLETRQTLRDGWVYTGDIGFLDDDGYLFISDRKKDMMIVSGFNVFPREIEDAIYSCTGVTETAVFSIPHPRKGEEIVAHVVAQNLTKDAIHIHLATRLARYKIPKQISLVVALPKTTIGKIDKAALKARAIAEITRS